MTPEQRSQNARNAANARWSKGVRPLPKRTLERMMRRIEKMTPEEEEQQKRRVQQKLAGFLNLYKDRPMA